MPIFYCAYTVRQGDTLSEILHQRGLKGPDLYGAEAWLQKNQHLNNDIDDWTRMVPGTTLKLHLPTRLSSECDLQESLVVTPKISKKPPQTEQMPIQPKTHPFTNAPAISSEPQKSPKKTRHSSAIDFRDLASAAIDVRYGKSFGSAADKILLPKLTQFSLMFESRYEAFRKLRIYFDYTPRVTDTYLNTDFSIESTRLMAGRAFLWEILTPATQLELTPKIGYWHYQSVMPLDDAGGIKAINLKFNELVLGGDIAVAHRIGLLTPRFWYGRDFTATLLKGNQNTAGGQTYRMAFETRMDGPKLPQLGEQGHFYVVAYAMEESTRIASSSKSTSSSDVQDTIGEEGIDGVDKTKEIVYHAQYVGFGIGLSW